MQFLADENFDGRILDALRLRLPSLDIVRVQDTEIYQAPDPVVLEWAAAQRRILLTHDVNTLINDAYARVRTGLPMPGVIEIQRTVSLGRLINDLETMISAGLPDDFANQVNYIPMK